MLPDEDEESILTKFSFESCSDISHFCLEVLDDDSQQLKDSYSFEQKEQLEDFKEKSPEEEKLEHYLTECKKHELIPVGLVKNALLGESVLDLKEYCVRSLHMHVILAKLPTTNLTYVNLTNNKFNKFACTSLSDFMQQCTTLKHLNLKRCSFGQDGAEILQDAIMLSISIQYLNLSFCNLKDKGGRLVANAMASNEACLELDVSSNELGALSGASFGDALRTNCTLKHLNMSNNKLYPEMDGIVPFLKGLRANKTLESLNLSWNVLRGEIFGRTLVEALKGCVLTTLDLSVNSLRSSELQQLSEGLRKSKTLEEIKIGSNVMNEENVIGLLKTFERSSSLKSICFGEYFYVSPVIHKLILSISHKYPAKIVIYKGSLLPNPPEPVIFKNILVDRAKYLAMKPKSRKLKRNMGHFMHELKNIEDPLMKKVDFLSLINLRQIKLDADLIQHFADSFADESSKIKQNVNIHSIADYYLARHPTEPLSEKKALKKKKRSRETAKMVKISKAEKSLK